MAEAQTTGQVFETTAEVGDIRQNDKAPKDNPEWYVGLVYYGGSTSLRCKDPVSLSTLQKAKTANKRVKCRNKVAQFGKSVGLGDLISVEVLN